MRKAKPIYVIAIVILLSACGQKQVSRLEAPAYVLNTNYERAPVKTVPLGEYKAIVSDGDYQSALFVSTDPNVIPEGTFLYIHGMGLRVACDTDKAKDKIIVFYESAKETVFVWAVVKDKSNKEAPYYMGL